MLPHRLNSASAAELGGVDPLVGRTAGQYEIAARVGGGGMGRVYKARDLRLERWVALKFLPPQSSRDDMARQRLVLEAQVASALNHRNVCTIHNIDSTDDGQLFIVMACYEGKTLKQKLEGGALDVHEALAFACQIADGLAYVHGKGIVHCDLKLSNLMVTEDGIKILDFGLANSANALELPCAGSSTPGTFAYMAPEQTRGEQTDASSDIWAIGVVLYEMLTGHLPFNGEYPEAISYAIRHDPPLAMRTWGKEIPAAVERLVFKALEKDANRRFQSARELARELRALEAQIAQNDGPFSIRRSEMVGRTISHYRITGKLGVGGMGVVYEAEDTRLARRVALKFVSEELVDDSDAVRRLKREAETIARLNHPHICSVYDTDEHEGRVCIVMERLEGTNLKLHTRRRTLETSEIVDIAIQITEALEAAHNVGIVHRDIKPGNIFVGRTGLVKVLDFGLAKRFQIDSGEMTLDGSTIPGSPIGTANYMAPERILQMPVDPRSDLFSLGVVIYEMATERLPFAGSSPAETVTNVLGRDPTPLRKLSPQRPVSLERVVNMLLAKQADQRYQSAAELRHALRGVRSVKPSQAGRNEDSSVREVLGGRYGSASDDRLQVA